MPIALAESACKESVDNLNQLLADTMTLRDMYKKHHWQASGPTFYQLHLLFDKHADEQSKLVDVVAERSIAAPRLVWELRDDAAGLAASGEVSTAGLGWGTDTRTLPLRFDVDRPPFSDGRLHLRADLTDDDGQTVYHSFDDARVFVVYPSDENRGLVRLDGRWSREDSPLAAELERA